MVKGIMQSPDSGEDKLLAPHHREMVSSGPATRHLPDQHELGSNLIIPVMFIYIFIYPNNTRDIYLYIYLS